MGGDSISAVRTDVAGYVLGDQTDKVLQPAGDYLTAETDPVFGALSSSFVPKTLTSNTTIDCGINAFTLSSSNGNTVVFNRDEYDGGYMVFQGASNGIDFRDGTYNEFQNGAYIKLQPNAYIQSMRNDWTKYQISSQNLQEALDSVAQRSSVTWAGSKALRDAGSLIPGKQYRITDYVATTNGTA